MSHAQACPVCNGTGKVSRPPWIAGDVYMWTGAGAGPYVCHSCGGTGYIVIQDIGDSPYARTFP